MRAHRFPRHAHVRASADFTRAFAAGTRAGGRYFRCLFLPAPDDDATAQAVGARLGMAVSRKVDKRAVERNRLRRLVREWFRHRRTGMLAGDLIVTGKREAVGVDAAQLFHDLDRISQRLGLKAGHTAATMADSSRPPPTGGDS